MVFTTRPTSWRTERSRAGEPSEPRKYLEATTLVASIDQLFGTSTSFCSKMTAPPSPVMAAVRVSQTISSAGSTPRVVKYRPIVSPCLASFFAAFAAALRCCPVTSRSIIASRIALPPPLRSQAPQAKMYPSARTPEACSRDELLRPARVQ
jgi:hypothetical protein